MTLTKTGLARVVLATGILLLSGASMAAAPARKDPPPAAEKSAPVAPAKVMPAPAATAAGAPAQAASGPSKGPAVTARKGRGGF
jgi:hypothetical protein